MWQADYPMSTYSRLFTLSSESSGFGQRYKKKKKKKHGYWTIPNTRILMFLILVAGFLSNSLFKITGRIRIDL